MAETTRNHPTSSTDKRQALVMAAGCYTFWGVVVGYFKLLSAVPVWEIIAHRAIWSFLLVALVLLARRELRFLPALVADRPVLLRLIASAALLYLNWGVFVYAVNAGRVLDSSFAYFINPILSVLLGLILLGERLSRAQWLGVGLVVLAILAQGALLGRFPWLSLVMAATFALYGFVKKQTPVPAAQGMLIETAFSLVIAIPYVLYLGLEGTGHAFSDAGTFTFLVLSGPVTVVPLILFATAAQRLPLVTIGLMQYIVPTGHFLMAILAFGEPLSAAKLATFVLAWLGLAVVTGDALFRERMSSPR
ncbi:MAG: EamA family transporter RarD [Hyphomicrobiaceae bacterium]